MQQCSTGWGGRRQQAAASCDDTARWLASSLAAARGGAGTGVPPDALECLEGAHVRRGIEVELEVAAVLTLQGAPDLVPRIAGLLLASARLCATAARQGQWHELGAARALCAAQRVDA
jgi:hypothetical protein